MTAAVWHSGFRPFYLGGAAYAVLSVALWAAGHWGGFGPWGAAAWHGHEMVFGFVGATCGGFLLTALPSWAHTPHFQGRPLTLLFGLWLLGRVAMLAPVAAPVAAVLDLAFFPVLLATLLPGVWAAKDKRYRLAVPILLGFIAGNLCFHAGWPHFGNMLGLYALMVLFSFVGGLLTPVFTATALRGEARFSPALERLAPALLVALAAADLAGQATAAAALALAAAAVHALRLARWGTGAVMDKPILLAMHVGYAWLVVALLVKGVGGLAGLGANTAAMHAFTVGALGMTKISLMTRVVLKHTGRPVAVGGWMSAGYAMMAAAALLRVLAEAGAWREPLLAAVVALWCLPFLMYLGLYGRYLAAPSLPRQESGSISSSFPRKRESMAQPTRPLGSG